MALSFGGKKRQGGEIGIDGGFGTPIGGLDTLGPGGGLGDPLDEQDPGGISIPPQDLSQGGEPEGAIDFVELYKQKSRAAAGYRPGTFDPGGGDKPEIISPPDDDLPNVHLGTGLAGTGTGGGGLAGGSGGGAGGGGGSRGGTFGGTGLPFGPEGFDFGSGGSVGGPGQGGGQSRGTAIGGISDLGSDRRERQEYLEDLKNYRTLDLPDEAVGGVNRLVESYNQAYGQARGANEARYQQLLGIADQTTGQRAADIRREGVEERSDLLQGLGRTGLANTTVAPTLTVGSKRREQESLNRLADQMQGTKLGIIERREDAYPDSAALQSSLSSLGEGYGGKGVSALYNALGNVEQGGSFSAPAAGASGGPAPAPGAAGNPINESGLAPAIPSIPTFGKQKGGDVFRTL